MLTGVLFYVIAALILFAALNMVLSRNLIHSVLFMVVTFLGIAFAYIMLQADYLAVVQVLVYVGAISVLFIFGVMLTRRESMDASNDFNKYPVLGGLVAIVLLLVIGRIILQSGVVTAAAVGESSTISAISALLLGDYAVAFEVSGILLLVAMIGAIILGKGVRNPR